MEPDGDYRKLQRKRTQDRKNARQRHNAWMEDHGYQVRDNDRGIQGWAAWMNEQERDADT